MKRIVFCLTLFGLLLSGCRHPKHPELEREVAIFFSTKQMSGSLLKSTASEEENFIKRVVMFGVDNQNNVVQTFPVRENPPLDGWMLSIPKDIALLYAIANPSSALEVANPSNVSDLTALTDDFTNAPVSPFLMGGKASVNAYNVNIELVRSVAKIEVIGEKGFEVQSVTVKNTPAKGFVFVQPTLTVPSSERVNYPENNNTIVYVAENSKQNPTTLIVKGVYAGTIYQVNVSFIMNEALVDIVRNTCYTVGVGPTGPEDQNITFTIREWDDIDIDKHYSMNKNNK